MKCHLQHKQQAFRAQLNIHFAGAPPLVITAAAKISLARSQNDGEKFERAAHPTSSQQCRRNDDE
jgi:hypothetical protein